MVSPSNTISVSRSGERLLPAASRSFWHCSAPIAFGTRIGCFGRFTRAIGFRSIFSFSTPQVKNYRNAVANDDIVDWGRLRFTPNVSVRST